MRYGLYLPNQAGFADARVLASLAREAEDAGWEGFFIWDELTPIYEYAMGRPKSADDGDDWGAAGEMVVGLAAIAVATERIRFGALVTPVARLRPEVFAKQTAALDRLSGGRLVVGVGLGNPDTQFAAFGFPGDAKVRAEMVDEFLALLDALWSGERVSFAGAHFTARDIELLPTPVQRPRVPIWIGADSANRAPRRRAARWDGFAPASHHWPNEAISPAEYQAIAGDIGAARTSPDPIDLVVVGTVDPSWPSAGEVAAYAEAGVTWMLLQALSVEAARARIALGPPRV